MRSPSSRSSTQSALTYDGPRLTHRRSTHRRSTRRRRTRDRSGSPSSRDSSEDRRGDARLHSLARWGGARRRPTACARERERYRGVFAALALTPSDEIAIVRSLSVPLVKTTPVTLPFDLGQTVADNCLSLSGMGYHLGIGGSCPACAAGDARLPNTSREALILAYVQQINTVFEHRAFLASLLVLAEQRGDPSPQELLGAVLRQPELFFVHAILRAGGACDPRLLFYPDPTYGGYMLYVVFPGTSTHLHARIIDRMLGACPDYGFVAHVWQATFVLVVRRNGERQTDADIPTVSAADIYCKMRDINVDGGLMLEYRRLYATFDEYLPP
ncbi:nuclear egress lamina protein [Saimiriine alphaherpesvirus 1]|uniref:Nuclear egress lamina protein n=1 Tax=Saimiriine herpesvirus 1 (strain MV-5-4-PSL) TaxID=10353 RepID=E2IUD8_SHV1|nr:nuclear egress lamina protein [Saimiriine alphaherpesvirus 1]ADO13796.1 nuclear egress lamina protein [Saimiriine alphaherpesvirus 1]